MKQLHVSPSKISGKLTPPPSKSQTIRALFFALIAKGKSRIENPLRSPDVDAAIRAIEGLGAHVKQADGYIEVKSTGKLIPNCQHYDVGNSGLVFRFLAALGSLCSERIVIDGDESIRQRRPIVELLGAIEQLGGNARRLSSENAPISVQGPWLGAYASIDGADSQPVSALLIAGILREKLEIEVTNSGEEPWVALTLEWLTRLGVRWERDDVITVYGRQIDAFEYCVPGDMSSMAFPLVAAKIGGEEVDVGAVDRSQGDGVIVDWLDRSGDIDVNCAIDTIPILAVYGCFGKEKLTLKNGSIARKKECDRIAVMCRELKKMGAQIEEREDGLVVCPSKLRGATLECARDHRVAMALSVAAMFASGSSVICGAECIDKTYGNYVEEMSRLGALMRWEL